MRSMKVILKQDVDSLGESGEVVVVKPGYARNYLIPHGLAYEANDANVRRLEEEQQRAGEQAKREYLEGRRRASQLESVSVAFQARAGEEGKLFGSVTNADIADRLNEGGLDFEVDRRRIDLDEPIKEIGVYRGPIRLHSEVVVEIEVRVDRTAE